MKTGTKENGFELFGPQLPKFLCLIFSYLENKKDFQNCSQVCSAWFQLIRRFTSEIRGEKYFICFLSFSSLKRETRTFRNLNLNFCEECKKEIQNFAFFSCKLCKFVSYCSSAHQDQNQQTHKNKCLQLMKINYLQTILLSETCFYFPFLIKQQFRNSLCKDWITYFQNAHSPISSFFKLHKPFLTEVLTYPLTLFYLLTSSKFSEWISKDLQHLTIHILGTTSTCTEIRNPSLYVHLFYLLKGFCFFHLKFLHLIFIGPDLSFSSLESKEYFFSEGSVKLSFIKSFYHNSGLFTQIPNLIVAFSGGLHDSLWTNSWKSTITYCLHHNHSIVFTVSDSNEAIQAQNIISSGSYWPTRPPPFFSFLSSNPFQSLWTCYISDCFFATNSFLFFIEPSLK